MPSSKSQVESGSPVMRCEGCEKAARRIVACSCRRVVCETCWSTVHKAHVAAWRLEREKRR